MEEKDIREAVRQGYGRIAKEAAPGSGCCTPSACCGAQAPDALAQKLGYEAEDLSGLPEGTNLGLSCGNPTALASLIPGEVVLDLGSGAGFDVLIASRKVGPKGRVIGIDMTPEMITKARANADKVGATNVEFRLGEIENLPVADGSVDVVISNCVINLSPDKARVFREIARVLKPGGRVAVSDLVLLRPLPEEVRQDVVAYIGCVAGAVLVDEYVEHLRAAGLGEVTVDSKGNTDAVGDVQDPLYRRILEKLPRGTSPGDFVTSIDVRARKA